jgi:hypothetical protein
LLGLLFGVCTLLATFGLFRRGRIRRFDFSLALLLSVGLLVVAGVPNSVNLLRDMLFLEQEQFSRLIAILILSNLGVWLLLIYTRVRWSHQAIQFDLLVRNLGISEFGRRYPEMLTLPPLVVVVPAYEEEGNIAAILHEIPERVCDLPLAVLVIDDGSRDDTAREAEEAGALVVSSAVNRGGGAALRMGFDIARARGAQIVVTMDADGQHLPSELPRLVEPIVRREFEIVIGSRILGERESDSAVRYIGIHVFNWLIRLLTSVRITDCSNGYRAFRVESLARLVLRQDQFHTSELIIEAAKKGIAIGEAPVTVKRRASGESKKGRDWSYGLSFARTVLKTWWR